ncbi:cytoplasmic protein [Bacillus cereus]|nr:cytoplasmic protein [Bacillus cereus]PGU63750.1 cytoplasmic protein [Bacillus cereus]
MAMSNNDILKRIRYAMDIKDIDMVEIFKLGGMEVKKEEVIDMLTKVKKSPQHEAESADVVEDDYVLTCDMMMLESFLNGFIILKRGKQDSKPGQAAPLQSNESANNLLLKKMKIALSLTSEDVLAILDSVGVKVTKGELGALLRKKGHKNYKECGDKYARNFIKGLAVKYRR